MVVEHLHARDHRNVVSARLLAKPLLVGNVEIAAMPGRESGEPFTESLPQESERSLARPESEKAFLMLRDLEPGHAGRSLLTAQATARQEAAEVSITFVLARQKHEGRAILDRDLGAHDQVDSQLLGFLMGAHDAVDPVAIGESEGAKPQAVGFLHQLFRMARAFEKRAVGFTEKRDVGKRRHISTQSLMPRCGIGNDENDFERDSWCKKGDMEIGEMWRYVGRSGESWIPSPYLLRSPYPPCI
jgi:hypothetical protein